MNEGLPRTNNHVEGRHLRMQSVGAYHPNICHFLKVLQREQSLNQVIITQVLAGHVAPPPRKKYKATSERLQAVVNDYENRPTLDFLRGISNNFPI